MVFLAGFLQRSIEKAAVAQTSASRHVSLCTHITAP
jgi:hypothetical protein